MRTPMLRVVALVVGIVLAAAGCSSSGSGRSQSSGPAPVPGNINLTQIAPGSQVLSFTGTTFGRVTLPIANVHAGATPIQAMNAFLAQYAYYLHTNDSQEQRQVLDVMSDDVRVRAQLAAARTAFRARVGDDAVVAMPVFWDTSQSPVTFRAARTAAGTQVTLSGGTLYDSVYNPAKEPNKLTWQDARGRTPDDRTTITELTATFGPTTKSGLDTVSFVRAYSLR